MRYETFIVIGVLVLLAAILSRQRRRFSAVVIEKVPVLEQAVHFDYPFFPALPRWILVVIDPASGRQLEVEATPIVWAHANVGAAVMVTCDWIWCHAGIVPNKQAERKLPAA